MVALVACQSVPEGDTVAARRAYIDTWEQETLRMLYASHPEAQELIEQAPGYLVISQRVVKIPFLGGGGGYGVVNYRAQNRRRYIKVDRLDVGGGLGIRNLRVIVVLHDPKLVKNVGESHWSFHGSAEASAKSSESATSGSQNKPSTGYTLYELTDEGVSVTWTLYAIHFSSYSSLN
jgi:lipid-binding SYLF domain-containing protein